MNTTSFSNALTKTLFIFMVWSLSNTAFAKEITLKAEGKTLNADLELAEGKTLKDGVVLFTHGTWMNKNYSTAAMLKEFLPEAGANILAINLSLDVDNRHDNAMMSCDRVHTHKHTDAISEISAWVNWLKSQGVNNITLAGHSRGGNQTAWYAALNNKEEAIKHIVLFAPQLWDEQNEIKHYQEKYHKDLTKELAKANALIKQGKADQVMQHTDLVYCKDSKVTAESFADYHQLNENMDTIHLLPSISKPVLIFAGTEDKVVKHLPEKIAPVLEKQKNITLYVVEDSDHSFIDMSGEEAVEEMVSFIQN